MKPQITIQDMGGYHNGQIEETAARLVKGASWKRQRCIVIIPTGETMSAKVMLSFWNLAFPPNNGVFKILAQGMEVGEAYSTCIDQVMAHPELRDWEYILTIEHDNMPNPDGLIRLLELMEQNPQYACIGGLYFTKGYGGVAQIWGDPKDPILNFRPQPPDPKGGLVECCGTGMGFNVWRTAMFKDDRLRKPWFKTQTQGGVGTQDLYFWSDARKFGYRAAVACDVKVGHYDMKGDFGPADTVW